MGNSPAYMMIGGDGQSYGPYSFEVLRQYVSEGRIAPTTRLCVEGTDAWFAAGSLAGLFQPAVGAPPAAPVGMAPGAPVSPGAPAPQPAVYGTPTWGQWTSVSLLGPILVTILCCMPFGVVSIVYAALANSAGSEGRIAQAQSHARNSNLWMWLSVGVMLFCGGGGLLVSFLGHAVR